MVYHKITKKIFLLVSFFYATITPSEYPATKPSKTEIEEFLKTTKAPFLHTTFKEWHDICKIKLPAEQILALEELTAALTTFNMVNKKILLDQNWVGQKPNKQSLLFTLPEDIKNPQFLPFAQKVVVPASTQILFHADLHGDIHALRRYLRQYIDIDTDFKLKDPNLYMIFLGDYVDRGACGTEVLYTLMRLKIANPDRVFLTRGNHEDYAINSFLKGPNFRAEIQKKYSSAQDLTNLIQEIERFYNLLPVVLYLGVKNSETNFITYLMCCHAGLEFAYNPKKLLDAEYTQCFEFVTKSDAYKNYPTIIPKNPEEESESESEEEEEKLSESEEEQEPYKEKEQKPYYDELYALILLSHDIRNRLYYTPSFTTKTMGFMWNDFNVKPTQDTTYRPGRGLSFSKYITENFFQSHQENNYYIAAIFRGHQHNTELNDMMKDILKNNGVSKLWRNFLHENDTLWDGMVLTLNVSPEIYGQKHAQFPGFDYDVHVLLKTSNAPFSKWEFIVNQTR